MKRDDAILEAVKIALNHNENREDKYRLNIMQTVRVIQQIAEDLIKYSKTGKLLEIE